MSAGTAFFSPAPSALAQSAPQADLAIVKSDIPDPVNAGSEMAYLLTVLNLGSAPAHGVVLTDTLPGGVRFLDAFPSAADASGAVTWSLGSVPPAGRVDVVVTVSVDPGAAGTIVNRADVRSASAESSLDNNSITEVTTVRPSAAPRSGTPAGSNCTFTQGFWKNHPDEWPVSSLTLGTRSYSKAELLAIFNEAPMGNGLLILAHQLIAAKLNIANGANGSAVSSTISQADALINGLVIPPVGNGSLSPSEVSSLADMLARFNEGRIGPGHCPDDRDVCMIECPDDITTYTQGDKCGAFVHFAPVVSGFCPGTTVTCTPPSGSFFPVGMTTVVCRVVPLNHVPKTIGTDGGDDYGDDHSDDGKDDDGKDDGDDGSEVPVLECTFKVTVIDNRAPVIKCPADVVTTATGCNTTATVQLGLPTVKDCDPKTSVTAVRSDDKPLNAPFPLGRTIVVFTARDSSGNTASCTVKVIVKPGNCQPSENCVFTQGFWKNHPEDWPVQTLTLGTRVYTQAELLSILNEPSRGNGLIILARQLIAAKLNIANGADPSTIADEIAEADALINGLVVPPVGNGFLEPSQVSDLADELAAFNEGRLGPPHCPDDGDECLIECPEDIVTSGTTTSGTLCGAFVNYPDPLITGFCPGTTITCTPPSGSFFPVGETTVTCRIISLNGLRTVSSGDYGDDHSDDYGDDGKDDVTDGDDDGEDVGEVPVAECTFTIIVTGDCPQPPVCTIECPENIFKRSDPYKCGAVVHYPMPVPSGDCKGTTVTCTPPSGTFFPVGTTVVTCRIQVLNGNHTSTAVPHPQPQPNDQICTFSVTIRDKTAPNIECPPDVVTTATGCNTTATVQLGMPWADDNCDNHPDITAVRSDNQPLNAPFPLGTTIVTFTATDDSGNSASCTVRVTVNRGDCVEPGNNCVLTQGFWKNHPEDWPVQSLTLGTRSYTQAELLSILNEPSRGNGLIILARQLIAAKLNIANGADPSTIADEIAAADALINGLVVPPVGNGFLEPSQVSDLADELAAFNEGRLGPPHCPDDGDECLIECPEDIVTTATTTSGPLCGAFVNYPDPLIVGFCPGTTITCTPPSGSFFPIGETTVTCRIISLDGLQTISSGDDGSDDHSDDMTDGTDDGDDTGEVPVVECTFTVIVTGECPQPPVCTIQCPEDIVKHADPYKCGAVVHYPMPVTSGDCEGTTVVCTPPSGSFFPVGTTVVTCRIEQLARLGGHPQPQPNDQVCTFSVTIKDKQAPVIKCPADVVTTASGCNTTATVQIGQPQVKDDCDDHPDVTVTRSDNRPLTDPFPLGMTTVTFTATDNSGNSASCTVKVTVNAGNCPQPPACTIQCPANIVVDATPKLCGAIVNYTATPSGNCEGTTVVCTPPPGSLFPIGTTLVTCQIVPLNGLEPAMGTHPQPQPGTQCSFTVTVRDKQAPIINCPPNIVVDAEHDKCDAVVHYTATASDPCTSSAQLQCFPPSGSRFPVGTTTVFCTATDNSGNTSTCTFTITVRDKKPPQITCPANVTVSAIGCNTSATVSLPQPTATDDCTTNVVISTGVRSDNRPLTDPFPIGTTMVTWTATDSSGNTASCTITVTVKAGECPLPCPQPPHINCPANIVVNADEGKCDALVNYQVTATDDCTSNVLIVCNPPPGTRFPIGTTTVFCVATDENGMVDTCSFTVTVRDRKAPVIVCPANIVVDARPDCCDAIVNYSVTAHDSCTTKVKVVCTPPPGSAFPVGTTPVVCVATDASGNTSRCVFTVTVRDRQAPRIFCPPDRMVDTDPNCCDAVVNYTVTATDNCSSVTIVCTPPSGSVFPLGVTRVVCTATDAAGNTATCSFLIDVCDHRPPVITCADDITVTAPNCASSAVVSVSPPTATDDCTSFPLITRGVRSDNKGLNDPYPVGVTTITWGAVDPSGNVARCSTRVIVLQGNCIPCTITCPADIVVDADATGTGRVVTYTTPNMTGGCNGAAITCTPPSGSVFPIGTTTVNCSAVVPGQGTVQCSFTVTVVDNTAPVITCPANIAVTAATCQNTANVNVPQPTVSDNSGQTPTVTATRSDNRPLSDPFPAGTTVVTFTATDGSGKTASCTVQVTVTPGNCPQPSGGCTRTLGYWKNHPEAWPVTSLTLGNRTYTQTELLAILNQPVAGNRLVRLAHQLIPAKLNVASGADATAVSAAITQADNMIGSRVVPPIGTGTLQAKQTATVHMTLGRYNEGLIGPGSCED